MIRREKKRPDRALGEDVMGVVLDTVGKLIASYLQKEVPGYEPFTPSDTEHVRGIIAQGDRLVGEDNNRIGFGYDTKNIVDLMRYLIPLPIPQGWRRRMIAFGSGDPTKIICSALIAQAFDAVRYPILPKITRAASRKARREILHIRDSSLYMPRDFDISPYFEIVKPTIVHGFDYTALHWADKQKPLREVAGQFGVFPETISPPLVPEEINEEAPLPAEEVMPGPEAATLVERVTVSEHFMVVEHIPVRSPEGRAKPG